MGLFRVEARRVRMKRRECAAPLNALLRPHLLHLGIPVGAQIAAHLLLKDLRENIGKTPLYRLPDVGSGLSVRLP